MIYKQEIQRIKAQIRREPSDAVAGNSQGIFPLSLMEARDREAIVIVVRFVNDDWCEKRERPQPG